MRTKLFKCMVQFTVQSKSGPNWGSLFWLVVFLVLCGVDMLTRSICFKYCDVSIGRYLGLQPFANYHFAFSIELPVILMYTVYALALCLLVTYVLPRWNGFTFWVRIAWIAVLAGALGNIVERLVLGYVRDFIQLGTGFFNLGDVYIIAAVLCLFCYAQRRTI